LIATDSLIVTVCPCGSHLDKSHSPYIPIQPDEIANEVYRSWNAGASIAHIHARDEEGKATTDPAVFREIGRRIREMGCDIILQYSTSPGRGAEANTNDSFRVLEADPEMASIDVGVVVRVGGDHHPLLWTRSTVESLAQAMNEKHIKPELEIFNSGGFVEVDSLVARGALPKPYWLNFLFDMQRTTQSVNSFSPRSLMFCADMLPPDAMFTAAGIGAAQIKVATMSILLGGHARVGFEDNLKYQRGVLAKSNAELVARVARIGEDLGRKIASPNEARKLLGLSLAEG
jgi:3-keto-5-aminohexanoate cleavage enzyme